MNRGNSKALTAPGAIAVSVEPFDDFLDTERTGTPITVQIQLINESDRLDFDGVDVQFLLDLRTALFCFNQLVSQRSGRSVPEPLARVLLHGSDDVLGIFLGLVLVEQRNDLAHHALDRFALIAHRLSNRDDLDAMLAQLPKIKLLLERLAKEAAIAMHEDQLERPLTIAGAFDHLLEDRSAVVTGGGAAFDELSGYVIAVDATPGLQLAALVGN